MQSVFRYFTQQYGGMSSLIYIVLIHHIESQKRGIPSNSQSHERVFLFQFLNFHETKFYGCIV